MNNTEINLNKLIDIIRKDTGINNTMDAIEQLSAILLLKYCYEVILVNSYKEKNTDNFRNLFDREQNRTDFSKFQNVFETLFVHEKNSYLENKTMDKIEDLLENIPFRIRSNKILDILLSKIEMINFNDKLAESYHKLFRKMVNESSASGAFYSPTALVSSIVKVVNPSIEQSIYDPALGTGKFLIEAQKNFSKSKLEITDKLTKVYGQDISPFAYLVGSLNLLLNGIEINDISLGDSLLDNNDMQYDIILSAIPFGKISDINKYEYNYKEYASNLETMFLKLTMKKLAKGGKSALIVPDGLLSNYSKTLLNIRKELLSEFNLHSILSLPVGILAPYTGVKVSVLFFDNTQKEDDIWFYELKTDTPLGKSNPIKEKDFQEFIKLFNKRAESSNSSLVKKDDVLNTEYLNLNLKLPRKTDNQSGFQLADEIICLKEKKEEYDKLLSQFTNLIKENKLVKFDKTITLGKLFTIKSGKTLTKGKIKKEGKYPVYGGNGIMGQYDEYNLENENIIIGRVGAYCGNIHFTKKPIWVTSNSFSIKINSTLEVYFPYLAHVLRSLDLNKLARGSAQPSISYKQIKNIEISLPSFEQQIELSGWFDEIQVQNEELLSSLELQKEKLNNLSEYLIISNCIQDDS